MTKVSEQVVGFMGTFNHERKISLPLTDQAPSSARHWFAAQSKLPIDFEERVVLLLSELVANSVIHSGLDAPDEVEVSVRRIPGGLHIEVVDQGVGFEDPAPPSPEHFGLRFLDSQTDRWGYSNHPTRVWFEIMGDRT